MSRSGDYDSERQHWTWGVSEAARDGGFWAQSYAGFGGFAPPPDWGASSWSSSFDTGSPSGQGVRRRGKSSKQLPVAPEWEWPWESLDERGNIEEKAPPDPAMERFIKRMKGDSKEAKSFRARYGDEWESVAYGIAWNTHKRRAESLEEGKVKEFLLQGQEAGAPNFRFTDRESGKWKNLNCANCSSFKSESGSGSAQKGSCKKYGNKCMGMTVCDSHSSAVGGESIVDERGNIEEAQGKSVGTKLDYIVDRKSAVTIFDRVSGKQFKIEGVEGKSLFKELESAKSAKTIATTLQGYVKLLEHCGHPEGIEETRKWSRWWPEVENPKHQWSPELTEVIREPRGECYVLASEWLVLPQHSPAFTEEGRLSPNAKLVHGYPTLQRAPFQKYGHAWIEVGNTVYDATHKPVLKMAKSEYYKLGNIDESENDAYDARQTKQQMVATGNYGPWKPEPSGAMFSSVDVAGVVISEASKKFVTIGRKKQRIPKDIKAYLSRDELGFRESIEEAEEMPDLTLRGHIGYKGKVFVYRNLAKGPSGPPVWSIKALSGPDKGRVIGHDTAVVVRDVRFTVGDGRAAATVRRKMQKGVHAGVVGFLSDESPKKSGTGVTYNPYKYSSFATIKGEHPVTAAKSVTLWNEGGRIWAKGAVVDKTKSALLPQESIEEKWWHNEPSAERMVMKNLAAGGIPEGPAWEVSNFLREMGYTDAQLRKLLTKGGYSEGFINEVCGGGVYHPLGKNKTPLGKSRRVHKPGREEVGESVSGKVKVKQTIMRLVMSILSAERSGNLAREQKAVEKLLAFTSKHGIDYDNALKGARAAHAKKGGIGFKMSGFKEEEFSERSLVPIPGRSFSPYEKQKPG